MIAASCMGVGVYYRFPCEYLGPHLTPHDAFHYYALLMPPLMAGVALGMAKLKTNQTLRVYLSIGLLLVPGIAYNLCHLRYLAAHFRTEARQIEAFKTSYVSDTAIVATDYFLSATFANRDQIYVYLQPPKGISVAQVFSLADVLIVNKTDRGPIEPYLSGRTARWSRIMETKNYVFYLKEKET